MARFVIDLGDVKLNRDAEQDLAAGLQSVALGKMAVTGAGKILEQPFAIRFPREWLGLILREWFEDVLQIEKQIGEVMGKLR